MTSLWQTERKRRSRGSGIGRLVTWWGNRAHLGRRRRRAVSRARWGEQLEARTLLSAGAVATMSSGALTSDFSPSGDRTGDGEEWAGVATNRSAVAIAHWRGTGSQARPGPRPAPSVQADGRPNQPGQRFVEVVIFQDSGLLKFGHADIAVTDNSGTTVYGQHARGAGNGGFADSAFRRQALKAYLGTEAPGGYRVVVYRRPITEQQHREITRYLDHQWQNDDQFNLLDDNCSQNVGFVLKKWDLLSNWEGGPNVINDDDFQLPIGDLGNDFLDKDGGWERHDPGFLSPSPSGAGVFDSVQDSQPGGRRRGGSRGSSGDSSSPTPSGSSSWSSRAGGGGPRAAETITDASLVADALRSDV